MIYNARDLIKMPRAKLWALDTPGAMIKVQMDDGVITATAKATIFSVYCWIFAKHYPKAPVLKRHHLGDRYFKNGVMEEFLNVALWDCWDAYKGKLDKERLAGLVGEARNEIYNDFTYNLEAYVQTLDTTDLINTITDPEIKQINTDIQPNQKSIDSAHRRITKLLMDPTKLPGNKIAIGCRTGLYKIGQVLQCVSARGYLTDYDSNVFRKPITRGYIQGFRSIEDLIKDSRTATKALASTEKPLQDSQYFNRKLQLLTDTVSDIIVGDCGTKKTMPWFVAPEEVEVLDGMYYVEGRLLKRFDANTARAEGLVGKTLNFRAVFYCEVNHPRGFCEACYGELSHAIVRGTNPGHVACTKIGERISQIILSTKHHDHNNAGAMLEISAENQRYIKYIEDRNTIVLADQMEGKKLTMTLNAEEAGRLADVLYVDDVSLLQTSLVSSIKHVQFTITTGRTEENVLVPVYTGKRQATLSRELLAFVKEHRWELTSNGNYSINLEHWDMDLPLFTLPLKNANMLDYMKTVEAFLSGAKSSVSEKTIKHCKSPDEALRELYAIVATQLKINLVYLQVLVKACMIRSAANYDYRLPLPGNTPNFGRLATLIAGRSMAPVLAYQYQRTTLAEPQTYLIEHRPNHPLDQLGAE